MYQAAFSQIDITPDFPVELIGGSKVRAEGVTHPLYAQTLLLNNDETRMALITIDNLGLTTALSSELRSMVANHLQTETTNIMLCFSHTHSAPEPTAYALNGERYYRFLCEQVLKSVEEAQRNGIPSKAGWALTETEIGDNRRDGGTKVDRRLGAWKLVNAENENPLAVVIRVTAHANIMMGENHCISSDYFGVAREKLQEYFGCPVMIIQGAAGNIKPLGVHKIKGGTIADLDRISDMLLNSAKELKFEMQEIKDVRMISKTITYCSDVPTAEAAAQLSEEALKEAGIDGTNWLKECERLRAAGIDEQYQDREIQFLKLNDGCICGVADEIFCEIALDAEEKTGNPLLFLNGYTNGCAGYLPNSEEWKKGGYETHYSYLFYYPYHGHVMPYQEDTADKIVIKVVEEWENILKNKNSNTLPSHEYFPNFYRQ